MGFFKKLFGQPAADAPAADASAATASDADVEVRRDDRRFDMLIDNGVRALQMNEVCMATPYLEQAHALRPDDRRATSLLAEVYLRRQDHAAALPLLKMLARADGDDMQVLMLLADTEGKVGQYDAMQATAATLLERCADAPRSHYLAAVAAHGLRNDFEAIAQLCVALNAEEGYRQARQLRAEVLGSMGQWQEALTDTTLLADDAEATEEECLLHARALAATGQADDALQVIAGVLEANPFCREAFLLRGAIYEQQSQWEKALETYDEACREVEVFGEAYLHRGAVKRHLHDDAGAADDMKAYLRLCPQAAKALEGDFTNIENLMNDRYRRLNPYQF